MKRSSWSLRARLTAWLESYYSHASRGGRGKSRKARGAAARPGLEVCEERLVPAPVPVQTYFVPLPEADIRTTFATLYSGTGTTINSVISLASSSPGTVVYYDQWEDGYDPGVAGGAPTQSSTQVWGDGNPANGIAPGYATDVIGPGSVVTLQNQVALPRNPSTLLYDGRDLIAASKAIAVTRAAWATNPGTVLATAVDVYETAKYGTDFKMPVGQNTPNASTMFELASIVVSAAQDGTVVAIDKDGPGGAAATNVTLNKGQTYLAAGGVLQGATVTSSKPVQVQLITGDIGASYESRSFTIAPTSQWSNAYYNPVSTTNPNDPTFVYLYNPGASPVTATVTTTSGSSTLSVPANGTARYQMPAGTGARFSTPVGQPIYAVMTSDSDAANTTHDWGSRLVAEDKLTPVAVVGWGPGSSDGSANGSPVWVVPTAATRVYVDYDGDPTTGALTDPNGKKYDVHFDLAALQSQRVYDPDKNQTGMRVYSTNGTKLSVAWGEDSAVAGAGNPFLDMGTIVPPLPVVSSSKTAAKVGTGSIVPGDTIRYTITVRNDGVVILGNVVVKDIVPPGTTYKPGTTTLNGSAVPDQVVGGSINTAYPLDDDGAGDVGLFVGTIPVGGVATVTFDMLISNPYTGPAAGIQNDARVESDQDTFLVSVNTPPTNTPGNVLFVTAPGGGVEAPNYTTNTNTFITVTDPDPNRNPAVAESFTVVVTSPTGDTETVTVTETGVNTGVFAATLPSSTTANPSNNGTIHVLSGQTLTVSYTDPVWLFETDTDTVPIVGSVQNPPVNAVPGSQAATQGLAVPVGVSVTDPNTNLATTRLTVTGGVLNVSLAGGATISAGANGSATLTLSGTQAQINAALATLTYTANYGTAADTLTVLSTDSTALTDTDTVPITVPSVLKQLYLSNEDSGNVTVPGAQNLDRYDPTKTTPQGDATAASSPTLSTVGTAATILVAATTSGSTTSGTSLTFSHTPGAGSNRLLLVAVAVGGNNFAGSAGTVSGVTFGGTPMTQVATITSNAVKSYLFSLVNPPSAAANVVVSVSGTSSIVASATTFNNVDQATPLGTAATNSDPGSTSGSVTVGSAAGELVYATAVWDEGGSDQSIATAGGQSELWNTSGFDFVSAASSTKAGAASVTSSFTSGDNQEYAAIGVSIKPATTPANTTATFTQSTPLAAALTLPAGQPVRVVAHVSVVSGTMPAGPNVTATLKHNGTTFATLTSPTFSGGALTWAGTLAGLTIPAGEVISLEVTTAQAGVDFQVTYDAATAPSRVELPASPVIDVTSVAVFDAAFSGGSAITSTTAGQTVYVRATVTDPFGFADVSGGLLTITPTTGGSPVTLTSSHVVSQGGNTKVFEYAWATTDTGDFTVTVRGNEGYEGNVFDSASTPFAVTQLDLGTPSVSQFTSSPNGPVTTTYPAGVNPVFVRFTDIDQNTNPGVAETITATITSSTGDTMTVTLTETGPNTGVFTLTVPTEAVLTVGNGSLHAPNGSTLTISYTDPNDPSDKSSATAVVGTAPTPPDAINDTGSTNENATLTVGGPGVLTNDVPNGPPLTVIAVNGSTTTVGTPIVLPSGAILTLNSNGSYSYNPNGVYNYLGTGQTATDSFTYTVRNASGGVDTATVTITINGVNNPPATGNSTFTLTQDTPFQLGDFAFPFLDPDLTDALQSVTVTTLPADGVLRLSGVPVTAGQVIPAAQLANLVFTPDPGEVGRPYTSFTFTVSDGALSSAPGTVTFIVNAPPTVDLNGADPGTGFGSAFVTGGPAVNVTDTDALVTDADDTAMAWLTLTVGGVADGNNEVLNLGGTNFPLATNAATTVTVGGTTFAVTYTAATGTFALTRNGGGDMPRADIDLLLRGLTYRDSAAVPTNGPRTIAVQTNDGDTSSNVATATVTVAPSISVNDVTVPESGGFAVFTVSLSNPSAENVTFSLALADGTAVGAGTDYGPGLEVFVGGVWVPATSATIPAGSTSLQVRTPITNDALDELDETFTLTATVTAGTTVNPSDSGTGTITDNDPPPAYTINDVTRNEGAGTMTFTVTLTGDTALTSTVNYGTASGTATSGADFTSTTGTLSFGPGTGTRTQTVTVPITNDSLYEKSEGFFLNLSGATNATIGDPQGVGTILDDGTGPGGTDDDRPTYTVNDVTVNEDAGTLTFTVTLTGDTALTSTVDFATASGTATNGVDFTSTNGTLTFGPGTGTRTQTVTVPITDDSLYEKSESFFLNLSNASEARIGDPQGVGTILDDGTNIGGFADDDRPTYTVNDVTVNEDAGTLTFTVTLTGDTALASSVNYGTASGTATSGADFTATSGTLNFPAGTGARTQTVTVPITDDSLYEKSESFFLNLSGAVEARIGDPQGVGTILDDGTNIGGFADDDRPTYTVNDVTRNEAAGTLTFTVTLTGDTALTSTVAFTTASGTATSGADFTSTSGTLTFGPGTGARTQTVTVPITNDNVYEKSESFFLNLSNATEARISDPQGMGTILDDGTGPGGTDDDRPTYTVNDVTRNEAAGTLTFTVTLTGDTNLPSSVDFATASGTATSGADFTSTSGTLNFPAGTGARTQTVTVPITNDAVFEGSESFFLNLSNATEARITDPQGVGTIFDDGTGPGGTDDDRPTYTVNDVTRNEGAGTISFTVTLTGDTTLPSSVNYGTASGTATSGADFTATSGTLTFGPGTGTRTQTVTVPITNDSLYEKSESFFLNLSGATNATIGDPQGVGTILDDGTGPGGTDDDRPRYTVNDVTRNESAGTLTFTVTLTGNTALPSSVQYATAAGSAGSGDFTGVSGTLNFPAGSGARTQTVTVPLTNDNVAEPTEQFFLNLSNATEAIITDAQGVGTILDDDASVTAVKSAALYTDADGTGDVSPGDTLRYTIVVTNTSANAANAVQLTDLLPDVDLALVVGSVTTTRGTVASGNSAGSTTVVVNVGTLAAGATATVQFRARVANPLVGGDTQVANQAAVTGSNLVTTPTDDPATAPTGDPTVVPINLPARLSGTVYRDNGDGTFGAGDTGISAVTLTLTGTTAGGVPITRTAVTNASGSYTFLVPASNAGGYTITETEPALYQDRAVNVGTLSGSASMVPGGNDFVSGIVSGPGATGTGYNFGETNLPPVVSVGADLTATFCGAYNFKRAGFFTDAAQDGAWTGTVDYGDGTGVQALVLSAAKTFQLSHTYTRAGLYSVVVTIRDGFGQSAVTQMLLGANRPMPQAFPKLVTLNDDSAQRSMVNSITVTFDQVMVIDSGAFEVRNAAGVTFPVRTVQRVINGKTVVVLEFTDRLTGGSLADGDYVVRIDGSKVRTLSNAVWNNGGVYAEPFFRFFGDADGDRDVDDRDLIAIQAALRSTRGASTYREQFDYDSDCDVDATDYNQFLARYRRTL